MTKMITHNYHHEKIRTKEESCRATHAATCWSYPHSSPAQPTNSCFSLQPSLKKSKFLTRKASLQHSYFLRKVPSRRILFYFSSWAPTRSDSCCLFTWSKIFQWRCRCCSPRSWWLLLTLTSLHDERAIHLVTGRTLQSSRRRSDTHTADPDTSCPSIMDSLDAEKNRTIWGIYKRIIFLYRVLWKAHKK